jgi:hypothetical protein
MRIGIENSLQSNGTDPTRLTGDLDIRKSNTVEEGVRAPKSTARSDVTDTPRNKSRSRASSQSRASSVLSNSSIGRIISRGSIQSNSSIGRNISKSFSDRISFSSNPRFLKTDENVRKNSTTVLNRPGFLHHNVDWHLRSSAYTPPEVPLEEKVPKTPLFSFSSNAHHSFFLGIKTTEFRSAMTDNEYCAFKRSGYNIPFVVVTIVLLITLANDFNNRVVAVVYNEPLFIIALTALLVGVVATLCFAFNMLVANTIGIENSSFRHFHNFSGTLFHSRYGQVLENMMIVSVAVSVSLYMLGVVVGTGCNLNNPLLYHGACGNQEGRGWIPQEELMFINLSVLLGQVNTDLCM